jgi:hypothetical protein
VVIGEVHPSLARICGPVSSNSVPLLGTNPFQARGKTPREPFAHPAGLWQNMLVTQPPTSHVYVCLYVIRPPFAVPFRYPLQCDEGIQMGQLYDFIEHNAMMFPEPVAVRVILPGFDPENDPSQREHKWYWEVRKGEVVRKIQPGCELPRDDPESSDGVARGVRPFKINILGGCAYGRSNVS